MKNEIIEGANPAVIESRLRQLWKEMAENDGGAVGPSVMRACVQNVVVYSREQSENELTQIAAEVSKQHPSRMILLLPQSGAGVNAWVTTICHLSGGGRKQVCNEQIVLRAGEQGFGHLPGLLRALLVPDLPVALWWRNRLDPSNQLFLDLVDSSHRVIVDSSSLVSRENGLLDLATLVEKERERTAFSDLNWVRITPWRSVVSRLYDVPENRLYLNRINRVEIEVSTDSANRHVPSQALLAASWLGSRLRWKLKSSPEITRDSYTLELLSDNRNVAIRIWLRERGTPGIRSIHISVESAPSAEFEVTITEDGSHLHTNTVLEGTKASSNVSHFDVATEAQLICNELEILQHDKVYEEALIFYATFHANKHS